MDNQWYRFNTTDKIFTYKRKGTPIENHIQDKVYFSDKVVDSFSLEPKHVVPFDQNFTAISNYFLDYWAYIVGMKAAYTYIRYVRHVYKLGFEPNKSLSNMAKIASVDSGSWATISELVLSYRAVLSNIRASHSVETPSCLALRIIIRIGFPSARSFLIRL